MRANHECCSTLRGQEMGVRKWFEDFLTALEAAGGDAYIFS